MKNFHPTILITGGAGFVGSHIVEYFLSQKEGVRIVDNFSTGKWENLKPFLKKNTQLELIEGDVSDFETVLAAAKGIKYIFHEAALVSVPLSIQQPKLSFNCNVTGTFNVFEAARRARVSRVVFASSAAVYGARSVASPLTEETSRMPMSPYALEKMYAEELAALYYQVYGLSSVGLRYFNVYGPRQDAASSYAGVISILTTLLLAGKRPSVYGDGEQTRDFVYVQDVVNANIYAMETMKEGCYVFNVGTGRSISIKQLFELLQHIIGTSVQPIHLPSREGDIRHSCADVSRIHDWLGWKYTWEIEQGLSRYVESMKMMAAGSVH